MTSKPNVGKIIKEQRRSISLSLRQLSELSGVSVAHLVKDAYLGKFNVVLVWALDRLSREGALAILSLTHRLSSYGVKVLSYQESWTEAPGELGEVLYALTGWVARMESQRRSERTKAGLARVKAQGKHLGRPPGSKDRRGRKRQQHFIVL